ncbi:MAG: phosphodiesterase [Rhodobacterales bacterium]|nr:phosphodiesterase [Rhodobacterales bacterium]
MTLKIVVLSDLHLLPEGELSLGLDTSERLRAGVAAINARHGDADFCIIAGDLADLGQPDAYVRLRDILAELTVPVHITIGNHDDRANYLAVFGADKAAETGFIDKVIDAKGYRVILLDSAISFGRHDGRLEPEQLDWLADRLTEADDRPVIVVLHHHANPLRTAVDGIILENGLDFADVLNTHSDIRQVIAGHVHYTSTAIWQGIPFTTLAGNHYNVTIPLGQPWQQPERLTGPAQMAVILADEAHTLVHFDNYIDDSRIIPREA